MFEYSPIQIARWLSFSLFMAAGQILFKRVSLETGPLSDGEALVAVGMNAWFLAAIMLYVAATVLWISVLRTVDRSAP